MRSLINHLTQLATVTAFAVKTIPERKGSSVAAAFGIAGVVIVMVGVLSIAQGFRRTMTVAGSPERAIILRSGADTEMMSALTGDDARVVQDAPGIARDGQGALASAELFVVIDLPKRTTGTGANVPLRGVQSSAFGVRSATVT